MVSTPLRGPEPAASDGLAKSFAAGLRPGKGHAAGLDLGRVGFMFRTGKHVDKLAPADVLETDLLQDPFPLCVQQSTGNSAGPEVDIVLRVLGNLLLDDDVANLEPATGS